MSNEINSDNPRECNSNFCLLPLALTDSAKSVLNQRYLIRDENRNIVETPDQMFRRVAKFVAKGDTILEDQFYGLMTRLDFLPNSPTLMKIGRAHV